MVTDILHLFCSENIPKWTDLWEETFLDSKQVLQMSQVRKNLKYDIENWKVRVLCLLTLILCKYYTVDVVVAVVELKQDTTEGS